jgi:hypothetical protein
VIDRFLDWALAGWPRPRRWFTRRWLIQGVVVGAFVVILFVVGALQGRL